MKIWSLVVLLVIDSHGWTLGNARSNFIESTLSECPTGRVYWSWFFFFGIWTFLGPLQSVKLQIARSTVMIVVFVYAAIVTKSKCLSFIFFCANMCFEWLCLCVFVFLVCVCVCVCVWCFSNTPVQYNPLKKTFRTWDQEPEIGLRPWKVFLF